MLITIGDLVEDVVVRVTDPLNLASDTPAVITRRRGGSAANVAVAAARLGHGARFVGRVGDDPVGTALVAEIAAGGVDTTAVVRRGRTGTILVLVDRAGERTMLTDRGASVLLDEPERRWLDGATAVHVPLYSLAADPLAATARTVIGWAHALGVAVSIDVSSVALIDDVGPAEVRRMLDTLDPDVLLANADESAALGIEASIGRSVTVVKRGPNPAKLYVGESAIEVAAESIDIGEDLDTTGAGDAFAAGFLTADWRADPVGAAHAGHRAAAVLLTDRR